MTREEIKAWVEATRPKDWYGLCAGLTDRVVARFTGGSRQWYNSAHDAYLASRIESTDPGACPQGGIHFWYYYGTDSRGIKSRWDHVTIDLDGGGTATLSATGAAFEYWGVHAGLISVAAQSARAGMRYLGWSRTYGKAAPLTINDPAAPTPPTITPPQEDDMPGIRVHFLRKSDGNQAYIVETDTGFYIPNADRLAALVKAYSINLPGLVTVNEYDWEAITNAKAQSLAGYAAAQAGSVTAAEAEQIAASVEARLREKFAALPGQVVDEQAKRLAS